MKKMFRLLSISRVQLLTVISISIVAGLSNTALVYIINRVIYNVDRQHLLFLLAAFGIVFIVFNVSQYLIQRLLLDFAERSLCDMRLTLTEKVLAVDFALLEQIGSERILAHMTNDMTILTRALPAMVALLTSLVTIVSAMAYLMTLSRAGFLLILIVLCSGILIYLWSSRKAWRQLETARHTEDLFLRHVEHTLAGAKELRLNLKRCYEFYTKDITPNCQACYHNNKKAKISYMSAGMIGNGLFLILVGIVAFVSSFFAVKYNVQTGFLIILIYLMAPVSKMVSFLPTIFTAKISANRLVAIDNELSEYLEITESKIPASPAWKEDWAKVQLTNIRYEYADDFDEYRFKLGPLDLEVNRNEILFIVGGNGSGKSTLGKLLCGIYTPVDGKIEIDGHVVGGDQKIAYRQLYATVFNDYHLFDRLHGIDPDYFNKKAQRFLGEMKLPYDLLSHNGGEINNKLSSGERKRLALTLSYLENRSIYLYDEWASDQDPEFRNYFYTELLPLMKKEGKTIVAITHDDRYWHVADRLIRLETGKVSQTVLENEL